MKVSYENIFNDDGLFIFDNVIGTADQSDNVKNQLSDVLEAVFTEGYSGVSGFFDTALNIEPAYRTKMSTLFKDRASAYLKALRTLKYASQDGLDEDGLLIISLEKYQNNVKAALFEVERTLSLLQNAAEQDFNIRLARVYLELGRTDLAEDLMDVSDVQDALNNTEMTALKAKVESEIKSSLTVEELENIDTDELNRI